jgi:hypothetical protein
MGNSYKYMLRYTVHPGHHVKEHLEELVDFCKQAQIDDIAFFINNETNNEGHLTREETQKWMEIIAQYKRKLDLLGVTTSINVWCTLIHDSRGRTLKKGQDFSLMVDHKGIKTTAAACPLCPNWREYIADIYSCYAEIKPNIIWVDDDFRMFNHGSEMDWGGCFCDLHMEEYSKRAGVKLTQEEFYQGILAPGEPHPYRKIWLDTHRDTMRESARIIGGAVQKVSPDTKVGLMCSSPAVHCAEARDWDGVLKGFSGGKPAVIRPHMDAYVEMDTNLPKYLWDLNIISRATEAVAPVATEIYPEIESCEGLRFSKSHNFTRLQLDTSLLLGADGITLNIFDQEGNGVIMQEGLQNVLAERKDFLSQVKGLGLKKERQQGIKVLISTESAYTLHTSEGKSMEELYPGEYFWAGLLSCFGLPVSLSTNPEHKGEVIAISGQYLRNLNKKQIENLFINNFIILDGGAVLTLFEMGYGHLAGVEKAEIQNHRNNYSFEQVCNGKAYLGVKEARIGCPEQYVRLFQTQKTELITEVKNPAGQTTAAGMTLYDSRVLIYPYIRTGWRHSYRAPNAFRQAIIQDVLKGVKSFRKYGYLKDAPYATIFMYDLGNEKAVAILNSSYDDLAEVRIYAPELKENSAVEINTTNPKGDKAVLIREGDDIILKSGLKSMEMKVLLWRYKTQV